MQKSHLSRHMGKDQKSFHSIEILIYCNFLDTHVGVTHDCPKCAKSYTKAWSLKQHMYSHTEIKPYQCPQCEASFLRRDKMNKHISKIHGSSDSDKKPNQSKAKKDITEVILKSPETQPDHGNSYVLLETNTNTNISQVIGEIYIESG